MPVETPALSERSLILLKTLVERYIAEGQPVGSRALSRYSGLDLSPASIRNVMADLEEMGFITSPHTSAGRVPTARGYRFFVDTLLTVRPLDTVQISQLEGQLQVDQKRLEGPLTKKLVEIIEAAGKDRGFTMIFRRGAPGLLYSREALDITDLIVEKYNQKG